MTLAAAALLAMSMLSMESASGEPASAGLPVAEIQGDHTHDGDVDNRSGTAQPTDRQRALAGERSTSVRWNRYGTPATLVPRVDAQPRIASGDPVAIARGYLTSNNETFGLSEQSINAMDVLVSRPMGQGSYVMLRQRFGSLPSVMDGLAAFGIRDGAVSYLSSSLSPDRPAPEPATLSPEQALAAAAADAGLATDNLATRRVQLGAVPMPDAPARAAYQVVLISGGDGELTGYTTYIDARTGQVLVREDIVDQHYAPENPEWDVFPANPPPDNSTRDTRVTWCFTPAPGCERAVATADRGVAWDIDPVTGQPSQTTAGNSVRDFEKWDSLANGTIGTRPAAPSPTRDYQYPWTNQWFESKCNPDVFATPQENDINAALANLFAMHNRMHDWSYHLGFTEETWNMQTENGDRGGLDGDAEHGNAQAGGRAGGAPPNFPSRNNANQASGPDGTVPVTNMFLWQPSPGGFYPPCVDGDYDMSVIGHEYAHAITGRMIGGPNTGWQGAQAGAMNESHSDLLAMEYLFEYGFRPKGDTPFITGGYVTGDTERGIRNYDMSKSPLNYSNLSYDLVGQQVHADGEIWSATSFDVRQAFIDRYGLGTPALQRDCADGKVPVERCPGNRRWMQLEFDALLLNASGAVTYVDLRDSMLAADQIRFGGANADLLWNAFAQHGLGEGASSTDPNDQDAIPSFASPFARNATVRLLAAGQAAGAPVRLYVGDYEARSMPVADTDPATPLPDTAQIAPGRYTFVVAGAGFGSMRTQRTLRPGERETIVSPLLRNVASASSGATASGDGVNLDKLIDDTEGTNWASIGSPVAGKTVTVDLAGNGPQLVSRVNVSALLRPAIEGDADPGAQNRFTALRQFEILSCNAALGQNCADPAGYRRVFTSPANAFPANVPRPTAADLISRSFRFFPTLATHLQIRVLTNQCTGAPEYAGDQDADPRSTSDCTTGNPTVAQTVRISELQAFAL
ncbi:MAG TPA: M36 family metallopeptidase [Actinophytocola sp.]|uniref:M36 family metallopeptidase n=1 Tax=Actinophytocola sp. TaxID=1872138 RepID=UPI002DDCB5E9|nr:M36 family metallopeptidase [Actinophytocola sp.]HEV2783482.1 M36 family metallopeptidase [Actinophytocola sp.]